MSRIVQVGTAEGGYPMYGYAPCSDGIPAQFEITSGAVLDCKRPGCDWWVNIGREPLTEIVAQAREHVEEAHRG